MTARRAIEEGDLPGALLWSCEALALTEETAPAARVDRIRIAEILRVYPQLLDFSVLPSRIHHACFSPNGKYLAFALEGKEAWLQHVSPDVPKSLCLLHAGPVRYVSFCPNSRQVI